MTHFQKRPPAVLARLAIMALAVAWSVPPAMGQGSASKSPAGPRPASQATAGSVGSAGSVSELSLVTHDDIIAAVTGYVGYASFRGTVRLYDPQEREEVRLTLREVLGEELQRVGPSLYLASARLVSADKARYTLDFYVRANGGTAAGVIRERTAIREVDGVARYRWAFDEKRDLYLKRPLEVASRVEATGDDASPDGDE